MVDILTGLVGMPLVVVLYRAGEHDKKTTHFRSDKDELSSFRVLLPRPRRPLLEDPHHVGGRGHPDRALSVARAGNHPGQIRRRAAPEVLPQDHGVQEVKEEKPISQKMSYLFLPLPVSLIIMIHGGISKNFLPLFPWKIGKGTTHSCLSHKFLFFQSHPHPDSDLLDACYHILHGAIRTAVPGTFQFSQSNNIFFKRRPLLLPPGWRPLRVR